MPGVSSTKYKKKHFSDGDEPILKKENVYKKKMR
jgi:hypothetical protein